MACFNCCSVLHCENLFAMPKSVQKSCKVCEGLSLSRLFFMELGIRAECRAFLVSRSDLYMSGGVYGRKLQRYIQH